MACSAVLRACKSFTAAAALSGSCMLVFIVVLFYCVVYQGVGYINVMQWLQAVAQAPH
jgi:hypothetical protein